MPANKMLLTGLVMATILTIGPLDAICMVIHGYNMSFVEIIRYHDANKELTGHYLYDYWFA